MAIVVVCMVKIVVKYVLKLNFVWIGTNIGVVVDMDLVIMIVVTKRQKGKKTKRQKRQNNKKAKRQRQKGKKSKRQKY